jgi:hypothetical protein
LENNLITKRCSYKVKYVSTNRFVETDSFVVETENGLVGGTLNIAVFVLVSNNALITVDDTFETTNGNNCCIKR